MNEAQTTYVNDPKNYIFICIGIFSSKAITGGDVILIELSKKLTQQGNRVVIITSKTGRSLFASKDLMLNIGILPMIRAYTSPV